MPYGLSHRPLSFVKSGVEITHFRTHLNCNMLKYSKFWYSCRGYKKAASNEMKRLFFGR